MTTRLCKHFNAQYRRTDIWAKKLLVMGLTCVVVIGMLQVTAEEQRLTIITEDWPPYNYEENKEVKGFSTEIVKAIMAELHLKDEIQLLPGARGEQLLDQGSYVMSFSMFRTPEREEQYKWIGPIAEDAVYFYKKKGNPLEIRTLEDAKKVGAVACRHKGLVWRVLQREGFTNLDPTPNPDGIIKKVVMGRVKLSVSETSLGVKYWLKKAQLPPDTLEQTSVKLLEFPLYIACTKDIPDEIIQKWQEALEHIKASGKYTQLYNEYLEQ